MEHSTLQSLNQWSQFGGQETNFCLAQTALATSMVRRPIKDQNVSPHSFGGLVIPPVAPPSLLPLSLLHLPCHLQSPLTHELVHAMAVE